MGTSRHRRNGVHGSRAEGRDGRRRARHRRVPRVAVALIAAALALAGCRGGDGGRAVPAPPPPQPQENFTAIESPSLQFLPRRDEAPGWQLEQDPIVIPADHLGTYLGPQDYAHFVHYEVIDATIGNYSSTSGDGFATVEIYRFPDFVKAFGAYSTRKSDNVQYLPVSNEAYATAHFINVWRGPFFVRIIGGGTDPASLQKLAAFVADRMPAAPAKPAVFNFFPGDTRIQNSEKYNSEDGFGEAILANSFQAKFNVTGDNIDGLIIPAANRDAAARILNAYRNLYIRNGKLLDPVPNLGEDNFSAEDKYLGRAVAFRIDRFVIAFNGFCDRQKLVDLAAATDQRILGSIRKQLVSADNTDRPSRTPGTSTAAPPWAQH